MADPSAVLWVDERADETAGMLGDIEAACWVVRLVGGKAAKMVEPMDQRTAALKVCKSVNRWEKKKKKTS